MLMNGGFFTELGFIRVQIYGSSFFFFAGFICDRRGRKSPNKFIFRRNCKDFRQIF